MKILSKMKGFTLAEVLITLTIIGVVAALTIPSLLANVNDKTYDAKRKGFETRMAQALNQMDSLNSYEDKDDPEANSSMRFIVDGLSKVYKITNVCEYDNLTNCDFANYILHELAASYKYEMRNYKKLRPMFTPNQSLVTDENFGGLTTDGAAFRTKNGESVLLWYYPRCVAEQDVQPGEQKMWTQEVCAAMIVDLDGAKKGPNKTGYDILFGLILYPDTPYFATGNYNFSTVAGAYPSYSTSDEMNAAQRCEEYSHTTSTSQVLPTLIDAYVARIFGDGRKSWGWTNMVTGSGPDDYGWVVGEQYAMLAKRTNTYPNTYCTNAKNSY